METKQEVLPKVTKKQALEFLKFKLGTDDRWASNALLAIYGNQTDLEKSASLTIVENGQGFTGLDSTFLSSLAEQYTNRGSLSPHQLAILKLKMPKYRRQIFEKSRASGKMEMLLKKVSEWKAYE